MNNFNLSGDQMNALLQMAGQKLGQNPDQLKQQLESGQMDNVLKNLNPKTASQLDSLMQDPKKLESVLSNAKVQAMLQNLMKGGK